MKESENKSDLEISSVRVREKDLSRVELRPPVKDHYVTRLHNHCLADHPDRVEPELRAREGVDGRERGRRGHPAGGRKQVKRYGTRETRWIL